MTKAISMAIKFDQDIMVTNMCAKFGEDWTNSFPYVRPEVVSDLIFRKLFVQSSPNFTHMFVTMEIALVI